MDLHFTKMHGLGNDFIMVDGVTEDIRGIFPRVEELCRRSFGIGADGLIAVLAPEHGGDFRMRIFNADGSEAEMCGNGIRCFAAFVRSELGFSQAECRVETRAGLMRITRDRGQYRVNMGAPVLTPGTIPFESTGDDNTGAVTVGNRTYSFTAVSMGNPHAVIHVDDVTDAMVLEDGPVIERLERFPRRTNVEFIRVINSNEIDMRVWERGCGETLACGTGACASVVAGIMQNRHGHRVTVHLAGGDLQVEWDGDPASPVFMTGPAQKVFAGVCSL
ncbi:MAG: diaminopimelate epimerase [Fibrobacterota bacterium]